MKITLVISMIFLALALVSCNTDNNEVENRLLDEHNKERHSAKVPELSLDPKLCEYAQRHAEKMSREGRLVHSSMSNLSVVAENGNVAENIAKGQNSEEEVCRSWMKSPGHKSNILGKRYSRVGFGVQEDSKGNKYWCAVFAG